MKRLISSVFITSCLWGIATLSQYQQPQPKMAQPVAFNNQFFADSTQQTSLTNKGLGAGDTEKILEKLTYNSSVTKAK